MRVRVRVERLVHSRAFRSICTDIITAAAFSLQAALRLFRSSRRRRSCSRRFPRALRRRRSRCRFGALVCCTSCSSCASIREASARSLRRGLAALLRFGGVFKVHNTGGAARSVRFGVLRLRPCFGVLRLRRRRASLRPCGFGVVCIIFKVRRDILFVKRDITIKVYHGLSNKRPCGGLFSLYRFTRI